MAGGPEEARKGWAGEAEVTRMEAMAEAAASFITRR